MKEDFKFKMRVSIEFMANIKEGKKNLFWHQMHPSRGHRIVLLLVWDLFYFHTCFDAIVQDRSNTEKRLFELLLPLCLSLRDIST